MTDVVLTPAACYPIYPTFTGTLPKGGRLVDLQSYCFRHEPSPDPARMQMFRIRENVRVGRPDEVISWRETWLNRGLELLLGLKLPARVEAASDPFFGRGGRLLAANQKQQQLKFEVLVPICSEAKPTAVVSFNYHQDHFGSLFEIKTSDGACAHSACIGFGLERVVMALLKAHGFVPAEWPSEVRRRLWT
jgi:seryl-tRNA synthetase